MNRNKPNRSRNAVVRSAPILRKGGAHERTRKAKRRQAKVALKRDLGGSAESFSTKTPVPSLPSILVTTTMAAWAP